MAQGIDPLVLFQLLSSQGNGNSPARQPLPNAAPSFNSGTGSAGGLSTMSPSLPGAFMPSGGGQDLSSAAMMPLLMQMMKSQGSGSGGKGSGKGGGGGLGSLLGGAGKGAGAAGTLSYAPTMAESASAVGDYGSLLASIGAAADI